MYKLCGRRHGNICWGKEGWELVGEFEGDFKAGRGGRTMKELRELEGKREKEEGG